MPPTPIDFFNPIYKKNTNNTEFGLCDVPPPPHHEPADLGLDTADKSQWIAIVENKEALQVDFYPVDCGTIQNNVLYKIGVIEAKGAQMSKCDVMLVYSNELKFVELKDRNLSPSEWIPKAITQLKSTIALFRTTYPKHQYQLTAHAANKMRPIPVSTKNYIQDFYNETDVLLQITQIINLQPE